MQPRNSSPTNRTQIISLLSPLQYLQWGDGGTTICMDLIKWKVQGTMILHSQHPGISKHMNIYTKDWVFPLFQLFKRTTSLFSTRTSKQSLFTPTCEWRSQKFPTPSPSYITAHLYKRLLYPLAPCVEDPKQICHYSLVCRWNMKIGYVGNVGAAEFFFWALSCLQVSWCSEAWQCSSLTPFQYLQGAGASQT